MKNNNSEKKASRMRVGEKYFEEKYRNINEVLEGREIVIIDPEGEYKQIAELLNGEREGDKIIFNKFNEKNDM